MNFQTGCHATDQYWRTEQPSNQQCSREPTAPPDNTTLVHNYGTSSYVAYPSSEHFVSYNNNTPTSQMSPISNSEFSPYSAIEQYEETSSVYAEEGISRYPPQVTQLPEYSDYSRVSFQDSNSNTLELVHSYRRLPMADEFDYLNAVPSSSQKKKLANQLPAARQQLTAKFECIACHARFSYESSAKRHQLNQVKRFRCSVCSQKFARVDYRNWHQRRCEIGFRLSDAEKRPG